MWWIQRSCLPFRAGFPCKTVYHGNLLSSNVWFKKEKKLFVNSWTTFCIRKGIDGFIKNLITRRTISSPRRVLFILVQYGATWWPGKWREDMLAVLQLYAHGWKVNRRKTGCSPGAQASLALCQLFFTSVYRQGGPGQTTGHCSFNVCSEEYEHFIFEKGCFCFVPGVSLIL